MQFYYADQAGQPVGPITQQQLEALLENGTLNAQSLVAIAGETEWKPMGSLFQIDRIAVEPQPQRVVPTPAYQAPQPQYSSVSSYPNRAPQPRVSAGGTLSPGTINVLASTRLWAYITSIYWWISALAMLATAVYLIYYALQIPKEIPQLGLFMTIGAIVIGIFGILFAIPAMQSWAFGSSLSAVRYQPGYLETACERQAAFFRTMGIYVILMFSVIIIGVLFVAMMSKTESKSSSPNPYSQRGNF